MSISLSSASASGSEQPVLLTGPSFDATLTSAAVVGPEGPEFGTPASAGVVVLVPFARRVWSGHPTAAQHLRSQCSGLGLNTGRSERAVLIVSPV